MPAADIETIVSERLQRFLGDPAAVLVAMPTPSEAAAKKYRIERAAALAGRWTTLALAARRQLLLALGTRIEMHADRVDLHIDPARLPAGVNDENAPPYEALAHRSDAAQLTLSVPARLQRVGMEMKLIVAGAPAGTPALTAHQLMRDTHLPLDWSEQRKHLGFA